MSKSRKSTFRQLFSLRNATAWLVLVLTLLVQLAFQLNLRLQREEVARRQFEVLSDKVIDSIGKRLGTYEQILLGAAGLFDAVPHIGWNQFHTYVERLQLDKNYPGIQRMGFSQRVLPAERETFVARTRISGGIADFDIHPAGERPFYTAITYLEPAQNRSVNAFGYDMYAEPTRREAMRRALETGRTSITDKLTLLNPVDRTQAGLILYLPIYALGRPLQTSREREEALQGFMFSSYRVGDLMQDISGAAGLSLDLIIYAGTLEDPLKKIFDTRIGNASNRQAQFSIARTLDVYGTVWTLRLASLPGFESGLAMYDPLIAFLGGTLSLLLFCLIFALTSRHQRAEAMALRMTEDIRQNRQALRQSKERLALALKGSDDGLWDANLQTENFYASPRAWQMLGFQPDELTFQTRLWEKMVTTDDLPKAKTKLSEILRSGQQHFTTEFPLRRKQGDTLPILLRGYILRDENGKAVRLSGTMMDLTERKRVERMKQEFVSTVSHELRTPLTSIYGALGLVTSGTLGEIPQEIQPLLEIAYQNSIRLTHLINDLLDMEKMDAGKLSLELTQQQLLPLIEETLKNTYSFAEQHGVHFSFDNELPDSTVQVVVDTLRLQQVLSNLLSNAIKNSPTAGVVRIACSIGTTRASRVRISVTDQGAGIPEEFIDRIFTRFAQADGSASRQKSGTGLGLAISKELVERMGGAIGFDTAPSRGTTFWFELPIQNHTRDGDQGRARFLIVEDEPDTGRLLHLMLGNAGYAVDRVQSLSLARERLTQETYLAMTLDLHLPDGNGKELIEEIRANPLISTLPIVIISADIGDLPMADRYIAALHKPISDAQLLKALDKVLKGI
ncbi:CHASE domain-containing protein [Azomonas macrocytogenes]|uniref:histidine kinase n=1 Tax=Azomonas macrocytogenes TaxID=69962 RepID=A0A839T1K0_AZOMA|nr:CHASE domain-containing protein [Azomonas macrocytogenes]MBB3103437.1 PAS domain S-box-containing protein [Azomonas macrocytogenes]